MEDSGTRQKRNEAEDAGETCYLRRPCNMRQGPLLTLCELRSMTCLFISLELAAKDPPDADPIKTIIL